MLIPSSNPEVALFCETIGSGPPVLFMHGGLGLDHTYFRPWLDSLSSTFTLIYYDHRGNGRSGGREELPLTSLDNWVDDADNLRASLGHRQLVLFGHSTGGCLALNYALRYPQHVLALILCSTTAAFDYPDVIVHNAKERSSAETFAALMAAFSNPIPDNAAFKRIWRLALPLYFANYDQERGQAILDRIQFCVESFNQFQFNCLPHFNVSSRLSEISAPTLVLAGRHDWITPASQGERLATGIRGAELKIFEHSGHFPFIEENATVIDQITRWTGQFQSR